MLFWLSRCAMFIGRIFIGLIFLWSAFDKVINFHQYQDLIASQGLSHPVLYLIGAMTVELLGGLFLISGFWTRFGAVILLIYMVPATVIFHDFWGIAETSQKHLQTVLFLKNVAICGGLLYVVGCGPGFCCWDRCRPIEQVEDPE